MNMLDDVEFQIAKLSLGPDDVLAVRLAKPMTSVVARELQAQLEHRLNLRDRVVVFHADVELSVVTKTEVKSEAKTEIKANGNRAKT